MSYLVLARKYRPPSFNEVSGQAHVTRTLANAIRRDKVPHAILLAGPRGVGKTSIARIFSKALNCINGPSPEPCLQCSNCKEITQGSSLAVQEIDGASHNSVDNVRELIETFRSLPPPGYRYKIYIIDEVHMLSTAAFNALLKSLEEPPPNTVFILATTEAHRIPDTVISRCQRHDLKALSLSEIEDQILKIIKAEKIDIESDAVRMVARVADGSMRDAQSLLDRIQSYSEGKITALDASQVLGVVEKRTLHLLSESIFKRDVNEALSLLSQAFSLGLDISTFLKEFVSHWRELLIAKFSGESGLKSIGVRADDIISLRRQVEAESNADIQDLATIARDGSDSALRSTHPKYAFEALIIRMATREKVADLAVILKKLSGGANIGNMPTSTAAVAVSSDRVLATKQAVQSNPQASEPDSQSSQSKIGQAQGKAIDWYDFVRTIVQGGSRVLAEHVKRLEVVDFNLGLLTARAPDFTIQSLEKGPYHDKFIQALNDKFGKIHWKINLSLSNDNDKVGLESVAQSEKRKSVEKIVDKKKSISEHPRIKDLQKIFPGSAIEDIKIKE